LKKEIININGINIIDSIIPNTFLENHPQHDTHHVTLHKSDINRVPDFIGGSLPHVDKDDQDFYWCTMLTFFKPWRHATDLKDYQTSWKHAFSEYIFTDTQLEIIKFFICML
jgi:hypothetical protein